jgi:hypothetical protein
MRSLDPKLHAAVADDTRTPPRLITLGAADWLSLAAAPTFAIMAVLPAALGDGPQDMLCATMPGASPLSGMAAMYLLMSAFHLTPWLRLISNRRSGARRSDRRSLSGREA